MRWFSFFILACMAIVLQTTVAQRLAINGVAPDLIFIVAVHYALSAPARDAKIAVWMLGIATDLVSPGRLGVVAFAFGIVAMLVAQFRETMFRNHPLTSAFVTFVCTFLVHAMAGAHFVLMNPQAHRSIVGVLLLSTYTAIYTAVLAPHVHWLLHRLRSPLGLMPPQRIGMRRRN